MDEKIKACYNCEHYYDMCACDWIEDIECRLIAASILKNDHWLYDEIEETIQENSVLINQLVEHVDYDKIYKKLKGDKLKYNYTDPEKKANIKMVKNLLKIISETIAKNCEAWDFASACEDEE